MSAIDWMFEAVVPIPWISVPRSIPAASAGPPSIDSAISSLDIEESVVRRQPKPAEAPEL